MSHVIQPRARGRSTTTHPNIDAAVRHVDEAIATLATSQHGVATYAQLRDLGLSKRAIVARARRGLLHRRHPRVYFVGHRRTDFIAETVAATMALPDRAAACGRCAASLFGLYDRGTPVIEVVSTRRHRPLEGATVRWTRSLPDDELTTWRDIRITTPARTIVDLAEYCTEHQVAFAIHEARRLRLMTLRELRRIAQRHRTRRGARILAEAIRLHKAGSAGTRSDGEDELLRMLLEAGVPMPQVNVRVATGRGHVECDFYWPELRINVELDGSEHVLPSRRTKDAMRDQRLSRAGVEVVRFTPGFMVAAVELIKRRFESLESA